MPDDVSAEPCPNFTGVSPRLIRDQLIVEERLGFERQFREAMAAAAETLDLTEVEKLLRACGDASRS